MFLFNIIMFDNVIGGENGLRSSVRNNLGNKGRKFVFYFLKGFFEGRGKGLNLGFFCY